VNGFTSGFVLASLVCFFLTAACFSCPGQATETVRQSVRMHNVAEKKILAELNEAAGFTI
jgi:hypothetical protein